MNKIAIILIVSALLQIGCNETKTKSKATSDVSASIEQEETSEEINSLNNEWINEILLDDGNKWEANPETNEGVEAMLDLLNKSDLKATSDYHTLASQLNEQKNYIVKNCTMKGPSHDNLHVFLVPLLEKIDLLLEVESIEKGDQIISSIRENLTAYKQYFQ